MARCLDDCAMFIVVMSRNYCNSEYCKVELEEARVKGMPVILIFIEKVEQDYMSRVTREVFRNYNYVVYTTSFLKRTTYKNLDFSEKNNIYSIVKLQTKKTFIYA